MGKDEEAGFEQTPGKEIAAPSVDSGKLLLCSVCKGDSFTPEGKDCPACGGTGFDRSSVHSAMPGMDTASVETSEAMLQGGFASVKAEMKDDGKDFSIPDHLSPEQLVLAQQILTCLAKDSLNTPAVAQALKQQFGVVVEEAVLLAVLGRLAQDMVIVQGGWWPPEHMAWSVP